MLRIVRTNLRSLNSGELEEKIINLVKEGSPAYLIVPEQDTVTREARMSKLLPPSAPLLFEVTNFTRFANSTLRTLGGVSGEYCDKGKRALLMWRTLAELSPMLSMTGGRREINSSLVDGALSAVKEMQSLGISAEALAEVAKDERVRADKRLESKLTDLAAIYSLYKKLISERYQDSGDDAEIMAKKLLDNPSFLRGYRIFIDGFTSFTEPQYRLIGLLGERCELTVYIPYPTEDEESFEYSELRDTLDALKRAARRASADVQIKKNVDPNAKKCESALEISRYLWRKNTKIDNITLQNPEEIRIFEGQTPFEMCDFVAADIKRRVMAGASFSDFAILARRTDDYLGILDTSLDEAGIPAFISTRKDATATEAIKLILAAYSVVRTRFSREDVISYAKCGLCGILRSECDEFETYVKTWGISGSRFTDGLIWNMNPLGYSTHRPEGTDEKLIRINGIRERLISPLVAFGERVRSATTVREGAEALLSFLTELDLEGKLISRAERLSEMGEHALAEENLKLWGLICKTLDTLVEVTGELPCDADGFLGQFKILISGEDIGRIPSYTDTVTVGALDMLRLRDKKHVYLIGVNAGELPSAPSDSSYFSERDRLFLSDKGLSISPEMEGKNARELFIVSRAFSYPEETLTLLYSRANTRFKAIEPSPMIKRIGELTGGAVTPVKISSLSDSERIYSAESALRRTFVTDPETEAAIREALVRSGHGEELAVSEGSITNCDMQLSEDVCETLFPADMLLSQSRLDKFNGCPLSYFCQYTVSLGEEAVAEFNAMNIGSFIHAILESFFVKLDEEGTEPASLTKEVRERMTREAALDYVKKMGEDIDSSPTTKIKLERLSRAAIPIVDGLCDEFAQSGFKPTHFELKIKRGGNNPSPARITSDDGRDVFIHGVVDRVDAYRKDGRLYVRVVDYKTGKKDFSPDDMAEGENLQMFLYLKSLLETKNKGFLESLGAQDGDEIVPAGVIYVKTSVTDERVDLPDDALALEAVKASQKREGMVLDNEDVIAAMGLRYTPLFSSRSPNKITDSKRKNLFTEESFESVMDTVESAVSDIADRMASGDAGASPKVMKGGSTRCEWCSFKPICRAAVIK